MNDASEWMVAPGYESVRDLFLDQMGSFGLGGGAFAAFVHGQPILDMWGGLADTGQPWTKDTTMVIMSATKGLAAISVQLLVDRGVLHPDMLVTDVWPEFGENGKAQIRLRDLLQHRAGVLGFPGQSQVWHSDGTGWDSYDQIADGLAASEPSWAPGTRHGYHAMSFGALVGEIVRRATGRTIGQTFDQEVAATLGLEAWIGTPRQELSRVAHVHPLRIDHLPAPIRRVHRAAMERMSDPASMLGRSMVADGKGDHLYQHLAEISNNPEFIAIEEPSSNGTATARSLARLWALMGEGGELDGVRLLSGEIVGGWSTVLTRDADCTLADIKVPRVASGFTRAPVARTLGYLGNSGIPGIGNRFGPHPDAYGAEGAGGQQSWCDPINRISVGYVRSECAVIDVLQPLLAAEVYRCAARLGHEISLPGPSASKRLADRAIGRYLRPRVAFPAS